MEYEIETENVYDNFNKNKEMFDLTNYSAQSKHYNDLDALVVGKIKDGIGDAAFSEFIGLKPNMYSILSWCYNTKQLLFLHDSSERF